MGTEKKQLELDLVHTSREARGADEDVESVRREALFEFGFSEDEARRVARDKTWEWVQFEKATLTDDLLRAFWEGAKLANRWMFWRNMRPHIPGEAMLKVASKLYSQKKVDQVFRQLVADYRSELQDAARAGILRVLVVKITYWYAFAKACGLGTFLELIEKAIKIAGQ